LIGAYYHDRYSPFGRSHGHLAKIFPTAFLKVRTAISIVNANLQENISGARVIRVYPVKMSIFRRF